MNPDIFPAIPEVKYANGPMQPDPHTLISCRDTCMKNVTDACMRNTD
jgi:hypothetical protein